MISNHFSTGHTHCSTKSHTNLLYFHLLLPCVPPIWKVLPICRKSRHGSTVTVSRKYCFAYMHIFGYELHHFSETCTVAHPLTEKPVEGNILESSKEVRAVAPATQ